MKALTWHGNEDVRVEDVPDARIMDPTDCVVRVTSTGLCGSDLHLYGVLGAFIGEGDILGHEPMGVVEEVGSAVRDLKVGQRVVVPFNVSCGTCFTCSAGLHSQCETTQQREHGTGAALFGYTKLYGQVPGGQAELLRVPFADQLPIPVPDGPADDRFVYLSDVLPTSWQAVQYSGVQPGQSLVVLGLGPIGDMCTRIARHLGVEQVIGIDLVPDRLERARANGVTVLPLDGDVLEQVLELTEGRGPHAVIDAVGLEAHGSPGAENVQKAVTLLPDAVAAPLMRKAGVDRLHALHLAIELVRRGGTVSLSGVYAGAQDPMPMFTLFDKQVTMRMGQANVHRWVPDILPLLTDADPLGVDTFATHRMPLSEAPAAYAAFQKKEEGIVKVLFQP